MDPNALNYDPNATFDNGSCQLSAPDVLGCTNPLAFNYNPNANVDDGSCVLPIYGCTNPNASNYNPLANTDDGSCVINGSGSTFTLTVQDTNDPDTSGIPPLGS